MLEQFAEKAAAKTKPARYVNGQKVQEVFVDPATLSLFITVITEVFKLIKYCRAKRAEAEEESVEVAVKMVKAPSGQEVNALRRILRRRMGWKKYFLDRGKTLNALLETGKESNKEEVAELWSEV